MNNELNETRGRRTGTVLEHGPAAANMILLTSEAVFVRTAGLVLILVGLVKIISSMSHVRYMSENDVVIPFVTNRSLILAAGIMECGIAISLLRRPTTWFAKYALAAMCSLFIVYRIGLALLQVRLPCPCLGRASDWLHISPYQADRLALHILFALCALDLLSVALHIARKLKAHVSPFFNIKKRLVCLFIVILNVGSIWADNSIEQKAIYIKGLYTYALYQGQTNALFSIAYDFSGILQGCSWLFDYSPASQSSRVNRLEGRVVVGCDGTNIYKFQYHTEEADKLAWGNKYDAIKKELPVGLATLYEGTYPPPKETVINHLWTAFASGCVMADAEGLAKPPFITDQAIFADPHFTCRYYRITNPNDSSIRELIFVSNGRIVARSSKGKRLTGTNAVPFDNGYTNAVGYSLDSTNIEGVNVPQRYEFTAFAPKVHAQTASDVITSYTYCCIITNVTLVTPIDSIPVLPEGRILATDRRFGSQGYASVRYVMTNGWLPTNNEFLTRLLRSTAKVSLEEEVLAGFGVKPESGAKHVLIYCCFIVILLPFGIHCVRWLVKNRTPKTTNSNV